MIGGHKNPYARIAVLGVTVFTISSLAGVALASLTFNSTSITGDGSVIITAGNGLVGIGTSSPSHSLDIAGDVALTQATSSIYIGTLKMINASGTSNTFFGNNAGGLVSGSGNGFNTAVGDQALYEGAGSESAYSNTAVGYQALFSNLSGHENLGVGVLALYSNSTGHDNLAMGYHSLYYATNTIFNVAIGPSSMGLGLLSGSQNVALGRSTLASLTSGQFNTAIGEQAGLSGTAITTGSSNVFLGGFSGSNSASISNAIAIGANSRVGISNALILGAIGSNQTNVGIGTTTPAYLFTVATSSPTPLLNVTAAGKVGIATTTPGAQLTVATGSIYIAASNNVGIIFQPTAGTCFLMNVTSTGAFVTSSVTCP